MFNKRLDELDRAASHLESELEEMAARKAKIDFLLEKSAEAELSDTERKLLNELQAEQLYEENKNKSEAKTTLVVNLVVWGLAGLFGIWLYTVFFGGNDSDVSEVSRSEQAEIDARSIRQDAIYHCRGRVREMAIAPSQVNFIRDTAIQDLDRSETFTVNGQLDAPNAFGVALRKSYRCRAAKIGENWYILEATIN